MYRPFWKMTQSSGYYNSDLEITAMRSDGADGQNVNEVNSAVRICHIPARINVKVAQERSQLQNREITLKQLKGHFLAIVNDRKLKNFEVIKGDVVEANLGAQARNYVLHPYKMVKNQLTNQLGNWLIRTDFWMVIWRTPLVIYFDI